MQWRVGAFEVMDESDGELLFSKLQVGQYASPKNDGSRPPEEERAASVAMEVLLVRPATCDMPRAEQHWTMTE